MKRRFTLVKHLDPSSITDIEKLFDVNVISYAPNIHRIIAPSGGGDIKAALLSKFGKDIKPIGSFFEESDFSKTEYIAINHGIDAKFRLVEVLSMNISVQENLYDSYCSSCFLPHGIQIGPLHFPKDVILPKSKPLQAVITCPSPIIVSASRGGDLIRILGGELRDVVFGKKRIRSTNVYQYVAPSTDLNVKTDSCFFEKNDETVECSVCNRKSGARLDCDIMELEGIGRPFTFGMTKQFFFTAPPAPKYIIHKDAYFELEKAGLLKKRKPTLWGDIFLPVTTN